MGRTYWFECSKCGYRAKVSGGADRGINFFVQTIQCRDCKELYDAVTRLRIPDQPVARQNAFGLRQTRAVGAFQPVNSPPGFQSALNRLPYRGVNRFKWMPFKIQCPLSSNHRVQNWNAPARCPRCGAYLEQNAVPYRIWD